MANRRVWLEVIIVLAYPEIWGTYVGLLMMIWKIIMWEL